MSNNNPVIFIVYPCFNEASILRLNYKKTSSALEKIRNLYDFKIIYVDDGSLDNSWDVITSLFKENKDVIGLKLSRNFGHQAALLAGMKFAKLNRAHAVITLDCDLQDDIELIPLMLERWKEGIEVVLGVRKSRDVDKFFKRVSAKIFYKLMIILNCPIVEGHADFRLLGRGSLSAILSTKSNFLFLRSEIIKIGFNREIVYFSRKRGLRDSGDTRYPVKKMFSLGISAMISYSLLPLRLILPLGVIIMISSFVGLFAIFVGALLNPFPAQGWASLMCVVLLGFGTNFIILGLIAEYIGRLYMGFNESHYYIIESTLAN